MVVASVVVTEKAAVVAAGVVPDGATDDISGEVPERVAMAV